jgi:hypothetical protein
MEEISKLHELKSHIEGCYNTLNQYIKLAKDYDMEVVPTLYEDGDFKQLKPSFKISLQVS